LYLAVKTLTTRNEHDVMGEFLTTHGSEVENMIMTEFNLETAKQVWREEWQEEARAEERVETAKWQTLAAEKDVALTQKEAALARKEAEKETALAALAEQAALIAELRARLGENKTDIN
jgi:hypothetical protein